MTYHHPRIIYLAHSVPGRTRLRLPFLRNDPEACRALADSLAGTPGLRQVSVRPRTGSVLCEHDPDTLDAAAILARVREETGVDLVGRPGEVHAEEEAELLRSARSRTGTPVARSLIGMVKQLNGDIVRATEGSLDLPVLAVLGFTATGALGVLTSGTLPAPPWFNLAWWAFRTFQTLERDLIETVEPARHGEPAPHG